MKRLTKRTSQYYGPSTLRHTRGGESSSDGYYCDAICDSRRASYKGEGNRCACDGCVIQEALDKLAAYEDIGYDPDELKDILSQNKDCEDVDVVHAHWYINCDGYYPQCSNCGYEPDDELRRQKKNLEELSVCPKCKAHMDDGKRGI